MGMIDTDVAYIIEQEVGGLMDMCTNAVSVSRVK